jgi:hypothetical protein
MFTIDLGRQVADIAESELRRPLGHHRIGRTGMVA